MKRLLFAFLLPLSLLAQEDTSPILTPEQIQQQLDQDEAKFKKAEKMFNPWYTGPLITPSASMMWPGGADIQPYWFVTDNHALFNEDRKSVSLPHDLISFKTQIPIQIGITDTMDTFITPTFVESWQDGQTGGGFGDLTLSLGWPIQAQTLYIPKLKLVIQQTLPTGKYKNLSFNGLGLNATGEGSWQTQVSIAGSKVIWWSYPYPMNIRFFVGYTLATVTNVSNFNAFGGGYGTKGRVKPGNTLSADLGIEVSLTERWVFAVDLVYLATNRNKFHGNPGTTTRDGALPATVGTPYNDNLSLAPAIEYNWNENLGVLGGVWFSVYGRSSLNFVSGVFSVVYTW